jgi:hypothetical protein
MLRGILIRLRPVLLLVVVLAIALGSVPMAAAAQANRQAAPSGLTAPTKAPPTMVAAEEPSNPYYSVQTITLGDGTKVDQVIINGPPKPPPGTEVERTRVMPSALNQPGVAASLPVPAYDWVFGCSSVSASMIGAYFDRNGLPNIYTGPGNGGVMPMDNSTVWGTWSDGYETYPLNPLIASRNGLDGRASRGSIDDYWVKYDSTAQDPYITGGWAQHTPGDAFGDYMKTSQSAYSNPDGATYFSWYTNGTPLTCAGMVSLGLSGRDGTYGRKLFYEARGYSVSDCYNQQTDNIIAGGFSFANYRAQIDAGYPVLLNLKGHSIVGIGYADPNTVYLNDTWDHATHQMTWGGYYSDPTMVLQSVSVVNPAIPTTLPTITGLNPSSAKPGDPDFTLTVKGTNFIKSSVVRWKDADRVTTYVNSTQLTAAITQADIAAAGTARVTVYNPGPSGGTSNAMLFLVGTLKKGYLPLIVRNYPPVPAAPVLNAIDNADGDGNYSVSWGASATATGYLLQEDVNNSFTSPTTAYSGAGTSWNATGKAAGTYYYRVQASNPWGTIGWSNVVSVVVQPAGTGPTPGFWQKSGGAMEFYVTADRGYVDDFAVYVNVNGCGSYKITHLTQVPISGNHFSFTGPFYASGTFSTQTAASGTAGLSNFPISGCGNVSGGPWAWSANWVSSVQLTSIDAAGTNQVDTAVPGNAFKVTHIR